MGCFCMKAPAAVLVILAAAGGALGQITPISAYRAVSGQAFASAPPDYFHWGNSYSNSDSGLALWTDGSVFGNSVSSEIGTGSAIGGGTQSSSIAPDLVRASLSGRAESYSEGTGSAVADGHSTLALRFSVSAETHVLVSADGHNIDGSFQCSLVSVGGGSVFSTTNPEVAAEFTIAPGTYDLSIEIHCSATTSGLATHIENTQSNIDLWFSGACVADFNGDAAVDFFDYLDFVDAFSANLPEADFNGDMSIDFFDYLDFVDAFSSGC